MFGLPMWLFGIIIFAFGLLILIGFVGMVNKFLRKVEPGKALIIISPFSPRNKKSVKFSGGIVLPMLHRAEVMDISTKVMTVSRRGSEGLICKDNIRADIDVNFYVRVNSNEDDVLQVADSIGCDRASTPQTLNELFQAKFSEALKTVGKQMEFEELFQERTRFKEQIIKNIGRDLNGYRLEDTAIDFLEQTPIEDLDEQNIMDSEGIKKISELTTIQAIRTNEIKREKDETIKKRDVEAREHIVELEKQQSEAEARQSAEVAMIEAREEAEKNKVMEEERLKAETAKINTNEQLSIAEANKQREIEIAEKNRERAVVLETERIEMEKQLEITKREKTVALATIEKDKAVEQEKKLIQDIIRQRVAVERTVAEEEEKTNDIRAFKEADRLKQVAITAAEKEAEENLIKDIKAAEAKQKAALHAAKEKEITAEAEKVTSVKLAEAKEVLAKGVIAEQSASGLAHVKVIEAEAGAIKKKGEAEAEARKQMGLAEAETTKKMGEAEAQALLQKGQSEASIESAKAEALKKRGAAEAESKRLMGVAEAQATYQMGEAEAKALQAQYESEAEGITKKAESMKLYDEVGREHEEFKLRLALQEKIAVEEIHVKRDIATSQAEVLASAMKSAHIDIVGGETKFFDNLVNSIIQGKSHGALLENNQIFEEVKDALLQPGEGNLLKRIKQLADEIGISSDAIKNLSVSALIATLMQSTEDDNILERVKNIKKFVEQHGLGDLMVNVKEEQQAEEG